MKKGILILFFFTFFTSSLQLYSQNWQTVKLHQNNFYKCIPSQSGPWNMNAIRIDSAYSLGNDSVFFNFNSIRDTATISFPGCVNIHGPSWLGSHIAVDSSGINTFFNSNEDSIKIKTHSQISDNWHLYDFVSGNYLEATTTSASVQLVNGNLDSVKQITIQCKDNLGSPVANLFNGKTILISKQYGIIKLYDFYNFPNDSTSFNISVSHLMTNGEVFDYNAGDQFGYSESCSGAPATQTLITVLDKHFSSLLDTVFYHFETETSTPVYVATPSPHFIFSYSTDTTIRHHYTNLNQLVCTTMPMENGLIDSITSTLPDQNPGKYLMDNNDPAVYCGLESYTFPPGPYFFNSNCPSYYTFEENDMVTRAIRGCGVWTVRRIDNTSIPMVDCYGDLSYIHKGAFVCGTPPDLTVGINNNLTNETEVSIFPNPSNNSFTVFISSPVKNGSLEVYNSIGDLVYKQININQQNTIELTNQSDGLYFVKVMSENKIIATRKIIKE